MLMIHRAVSPHEVNTNQRACCPPNTSNVSRGRLKVTRVSEVVKHPKMAEKGSQCLVSLCGKRHKHRSHTQDPTELMEPGNVTRGVLERAGVEWSL